MFFFVRSVFAFDRFRVHFRFYFCSHVRFHRSSCSCLISFAFSFSVTFSFLLMYAVVVVRCRGHSRFRPFCVFVRFRFRRSSLSFVLGFCVRCRVGFRLCVRVCLHVRIRLRFLFSCTCLFTCPITFSCS